MTKLNEVTQGGHYEPSFYLPTPSAQLNDLIRGGGVQSNAIMQFQSKDEGSFKSTMALQMLGKAQKMGLNVGFIDAEMAMDTEWAKQIGVDTDSWYYSQPTTGENAWELCFEMIQEYDCKVVVLDSIDSMQPEHLYESDLGDSHIGNHAKLHSKAIRKALPIIAQQDAIIIAINQKRVNLTQMGARGYNSGGGKAWGFYSKLIVDCKRGSANSNKGNDIIDIDLYIEKNKIGSSFKTIPVKCQQGIGIMWEHDKLNQLLKSGEVTKGGSWYRFGDDAVAQGDEQMLNWIRENYEA